MSKDEIDELHFRLPRKHSLQIRKIADAENRSLTKQLAHIVREWLEGYRQRRAAK